MSGNTFTCKNILFLQHKHLLVDQSNALRARLSVDHPDIVLHAACSSDEVKSLHYDAVLTPTLSWLPTALSKCRSFSWVHFLSAGVERIWAMPIDWSTYHLSCSRGIHGSQISEFTIGALLYFSKKFNIFSEQSRNYKWNRFWLDEISGKKALLLGGGTIAKSIASKLSCFDIQSFVVKRSPTPLQWSEDVMTFDDSFSILPQVDFLIVCLPLTPQTKFLVNYSYLSRLKKGSLLVDVSRGGVVDPLSIYKCVESGLLAGACLDVFPEEPLSPSSFLWNHPRILITPHVSGTSPRYFERAIECFLSNLTSLILHGYCSTPVDFAFRY